MTVYAAFLRAINVGGTGKLAMADLVRLCENAGLAEVKTYIQSGNVVFRSKLGEAAVCRKLEPALEKKLGKPVGVLVRTAEELGAIIENNPFPKAAPNRVLIFFLPKALASGALRDLKIPGSEEVVPAGREVYVHYPDGMGRSKLKLPFANVGTGRNLNTVIKVLDLCHSLTSS